MESRELEQKLAGLTRPDPTNDMHKQQLRLTLLNARRTAWWGTLLVIIPALFLLGVFLKYVLGFGLVFDPLEEYIFGPIVNSQNTRFLEPLFLFVIPLTALVINVLSITHFSNQPTEVVISVKKRWMNWLIVAISGGIVSVIFLYALKGDR